MESGNGLLKKSGVDTLSVAGSSNVVKWAAATMRYTCFGYCSEGGYFLQNIFICGGREITVYCNVLAEY